MSKSLSKNKTTQKQTTLWQPGFAVSVFIPCAITPPPPLSLSFSSPPLLHYTSLHVGVVSQAWHITSVLSERERTESSESLHTLISKLPRLWMGSSIVLRMEGAFAITMQGHRVRARAALRELQSAASLMV